MSLEQNVSLAMCGHSLDKDPHLPSPSSWGWEREDSKSYATSLSPGLPKWTDSLWLQKGLSGQNAEKQTSTVLFFVVFFACGVDCSHED
jgi:hypothetical protein